MCAAIWTEAELNWKSPSSLPTLFLTEEGKKAGRVRISFSRVRQSGEQNLDSSGQVLHDTDQGSSPCSVTARCDPTQVLDLPAPKRWKTGEAPAHISVSKRESQGDK